MTPGLKLSLPYATSGAYEPIVSNEVVLRRKRVSANVCTLSLGSAEVFDTTSFPGIPEELTSFGIIGAPTNLFWYNRSSD